MKMKALFIFGWACIALSIALQPSGFVVAAAMFLAFLGGHLLGWRNGRLDAADMIRNEFRKGSKLL